MGKKVYLFMVVVCLSVIFGSELNVNASSTINSKKVSMEKLVYLREDQYSLGRYLKGSEVICKSEEVMSSILKLESGKVVISEADGFSKNQIKTVVAVLENKYFPFSELPYVEKDTINYKVEIPVVKAKNQYRKSKTIQDRIDQILFKELKITENTTEYEALVKINDWFFNNCKYNYKYTAPMSIEDVVVNNTGICGSFTDTFKVMCNRLGIECYAVASDKMCHAWNKVILNGKAYYVDTTWNLLGYYQDYFLKDEKTMSKTHVKPNWIDTKRVKIPSYSTISYALNVEYEINNKKNPKYVVQGTRGKLYSPKKSGYLFKGWYIDKCLTKKVNNLNQLGTSPSITLYPKWEKIKKPRITSCKVREYSKRTKVSWKSTQGNRVKYLVTFRSQDKNFQTICVSRNQAVIYKERTDSKNKYTLVIRSYILDSAGKKVCSNKILIEDGKIIK